MQPVVKNVIFCVQLFVADPVCILYGSFTVLSLKPFCMQQSVHLFRGTGF